MTQGFLERHQDVHEEWHHHGPGLVQIRISFSVGQKALDWDCVVNLHWVRSLGSRGLGLKHALDRFIGFSSEIIWVFLWVFRF